MLKRSSIQRKPSTKEPKPKVKKCKVCKTGFTPRDLMREKWCSVECGAILGQRLDAEKKAKAARIDRIETKKKLTQFKTIAELKAELQIIFNKYIRIRDEFLPCICCGKWPKTDGSLTGGAWDAAHYRSRGSADHIRFNEDNVHKSLKDCNKYGHFDYRSGLIKKIGLERTEAVECNNDLIKWTREFLESEKIRYLQKTRELITIRQ